MRLARLIDRLNGAVGRAAAWLGLLMVLVAAFNAIDGKLDPHVGARLSFVGLAEAEWYLFAILFLFAAPWALREGAHVRVDVLYGRLGARGKALTNLLGGLLLALPFAVYSIWVTVPSAIESVRVREMSADAGGLPRYPLQILVPVAFGLLALQVIAELIRATHTLRSEDHST